MSGSITSTGMLTNNGKNFLDIKDDLDKKIKNIVIHNIPLSNSTSMKVLKSIGTITAPFIHSALTPTLSHIAIQLNLENSDYIYVIEYGQYYSKDSKLKTSSFGSGSKSSNDPRKSANKHDYYYINIDGARVTRLSYDHFKTNPAYMIMSILTHESVKDQVESIRSRIVSGEIAKEFFGHEGDESILDQIYRIECDVKNKITLGELCKNFKNENWLAKNYNVAGHNCQTFATEIIIILKAIRVNESDKIRSHEKVLLPNCLIKALWKNEDLSIHNTLGRIPIFGLFYDCGYDIGNLINEKVAKNNNNK